MSVEKMKLLSITGKEENIDGFIAEYLLDSGIQTENATKVYEKGWKLKNFEYDSTAKDLLKKCEEILDKYDIKYDKNIESDRIGKSLEDIKKQLESIKSNFDKYEADIKNKDNELTELKKRAEVLKNAKNLNIDLKALYNMEYLRFRYGKITKQNLDKLEKNLGSLNTIILNITEEDDYVWIMCITTKEAGAKTDSYLNMFKFERYWIPKELDGNPRDMWKDSENEIQKLNFEIDNLKDEIIKIKNTEEENLINLYAEINLYLKINNVKKFMAYDENGLFYIIGWIPAKELNRILPKLSKDKDLKYFVKNHDEVASTPPTKLRNGRLIKPFEEIVKMYGLPNYTESDPTLFVAITAFLLFGFMFGDVGHGLVIFIIGFFMERKKMQLGAVFEAGGLSSIIFGLLYGSIFGNEEVLPTIFISPMENIQTMLIYGILIGVILIISAMVMNIKNGIKNKDKKKILFDTNGLAGLIFYLTVLISGVYFLVNGKMLVSMSFLSVFIILPLVLIMFKDNISEKLFKEKDAEHTTIVEKLFEVVEILLSFASNTISFVRISAFAINHVGLCMAIYILADMVSGSGSMVITIIGNALVIVLEGLIVGIQVLRLEYYELFSRFYTGDGKEYKPLREKI